MNKVGAVPLGPLSRWQGGWRDWCNFAGLILGVAGAALVAFGAFSMTPERAIELGAARFASANPSDMLKQPQIAEILSDARSERWGFVLVSVGFLLQVPAGLTAILVRRP